MIIFIFKIRSFYIEIMPETIIYSILFMHYHAGQRNETVEYGSCCFNSCCEKSP